METRQLYPLYPVRTNNRRYHRINHNMTPLEQIISLYLKEHHPRWQLVPNKHTVTELTELRPKNTNNITKHIYINDTDIMTLTSALKEEPYTHQNVLQIITKVINKQQNHELTPTNHRSLLRRKPPRLDNRNRK